ncbi:AlkA N-terminal domain-containing protein [Microbacterium sp.]|uniref:AlkA N-terminal domain-containing protein n=1 Tax=Microbacterium sp. TaxID=51671 RepID=UPI0037C9FFA6
MTGTTMTFDERYRAIESRDARFDGQFVTAVRSTGIYCRPSCPARTPKPVNVTFYPTSAAAHEAGYRACKRCLPEAAPGSPEWNLRGDAAGRAMRLIADGVIEREGVPGLAARLGYSPRHLTRLLVAELGAGPLALARAHRAHTARMLLVGTDLSAADVAFSAGFASVRQFNDTMREVFGLTPLELRARRPSTGSGSGAGLGSGHGSGPSAGPGSGHGSGPSTGSGSGHGSGQEAGSISLALPVRRPFDAAGLFAWMTARALPGIEHATADSYARTLALPGGPAWFRLRHDGTRVRLDARLAHLADLPVLVGRARRLFDLDADPIAVDAALAEHAEAAPLVAATPGIRVPGAADPAEMLIRAMIGQQVSVASARTALTRLADALGAPVDVGTAAEGEGVDRLFPTMAAIAEHGHEVLRGPAARIRAVTGAAAALAAGDLVLSPGDDNAAQRAALLALPGIGPWTADYVRMRITGDPDVILPGDVAVRTGAAAAGIPSDAAGLTAWAARTAPWRSYLTAHLWRAAAAPAPRPGAAAPRPAAAAPRPAAAAAPRPAVRNSVSASGVRPHRPENTRTPARPRPRGD